jgi:hypothetical protein
MIGREAGARKVRRTTLFTLAAVSFAVLVARADDAAPPAPGARWLVGDLHVHVSPPDEPGHSSLTVAAAIEAARKASLDFIVLTPHDADRTFPDPRGGAAAAVTGQELAAALASEELRRTPAAGDGPPRPLIVVSGWEFTRESPGHLGVSFVRVRDLAGARDDAKAAAAIAKGALVVVNHPFFRPVESDLPLMKLLKGDRRWRPFCGEAKDDLAWNGIEVWHERSVLVEKLHTKLAQKFPATQMVTDSLRAWDEATKRGRRRIVGVGGSDCHGKAPYAILPMPMLSVRVESADEDGLRKGLLAAHVTFGRDGGPAARDFAATSDVAGERASTGDSLRAKTEVRLTWSGKATLVEDGVRAGEFDGGAVRKVDPPGSFHSWRIEKPGDAYGNPIYANLP